MACGYCRTCNSFGGFPSNPSRPSSTYSSSRRTSIKAGDQRSIAVAETAERTARVRTSRRQRFVIASVGAGLRRFWPARGARRGRGGVAARIGDFVSGGFRREGIGTPRWRQAGPTDASRPVPCSKGSRCTNLWDFVGQRGGGANRFRVCDTQNVIRWEEVPTLETLLSRMCHPMMAVDKPLEILKAR